MRLKNINIDERSSTFTDEKQKRSLKEMSSSINKLGEVFDNMVNLEAFIIQGIQNELAILLSIRQDKENIIQQYGLETYLEEYFKPAVYKIEDKIINVLQDWDNAGDRLETQEIKNTILVLKEVSSILDKIATTKLKSLAILDDMINEFGYFQVCRAIFTSDIVERMNILTQLRLEIDKIFSPPKANEPVEPEKRRQKLTIDDL